MSTALTYDELVARCLRLQLDLDKANKNYMEIIDAMDCGVNEEIWPPDMPLPEAIRRLKEHVINLD